MKAILATALRSLKNSGPQRHLNPWPCDSGAMLKLTELWRHRQRSDGHFWNKHRNEEIMSQLQWETNIGRKIWTWTPHLLEVINVLLKTSNFVNYKIDLKENVINIVFKYNVFLICWGGGCVESTSMLYSLLRFNWLDLSLPECNIHPIPSPSLGKQPTHCSCKLGFLTLCVD